MIYTERFNYSRFLFLQPDDADRYEGDVGSVASFLLENCKLPLALVQPADYSFDDDNAASVATSED